MTKAQALAVLVLSLATAAQAQDGSTLTAEELAARFQAQSDEMTRGLVIAPKTAEPATEAAAEALPPETTYVAVDPAAQVNIQIEFAFDSAAIGPGQEAKLATLCEVMKTSEIPSFKIIGHTDSSGTDSYNQNLSLLRAEEVKRHLVEGCGVPEGKLMAEGVGEAFPADVADPAAEVNRRVEFQVGS